MYAADITSFGKIASVQNYVENEIKFVIFLENMERIRKVGTTLRNNWKKSVFFSLVGGYGLNWYNKKLQDDAFMRDLAREALSYGSVTIQGVQTPAYNVTVILNPVASGGKGRKLYEQYCAPLLHLAGMKVSPKGHIISF